jgi:hypothetical protein
VDVETGNEFPVELAYRGCKGGIDHWQATADVTVDPSRSYVVVADEIPGHCSIEVTVARRGPEPTDDDGNL